MPEGDTVTPRAGHFTILGGLLVAVIRLSDWRTVKEAIRPLSTRTSRADTNCPAVPRPCQWLAAAERGDASEKPSRFNNWHADKRGVKVYLSCLVYLQPHLKGVHRSSGQQPCQQYGIPAGFAALAPRWFSPRYWRSASALSLRRPRHNLRRGQRRRGRRIRARGRRFRRRARARPVAGASAAGRAAAVAGRATSRATAAASTVGATGRSSSRADNWCSMPSI